MDIKTVSDIHLEFTTVKKALLNIDAKKSENTILILSGDVGYPITNVSKKKYLFKKKHNLKFTPKINSNYVEFLKILKNLYYKVIMVSGNHEYYTCLTNDISMEEMDEIILKICNEIGIIFLQNSSVEINNQIFYGCTLFSLVKLEDFYMMNDSNFITAEIEKIHEYFKKSFDWLKSQKIDENSIVITHHLPTYKLLPSFSELKSAYATEILYHFKPKIWISGHSHTHRDIYLENTRCIINPRGYPGEKTGYVETLVVL